jgi:hypothetical protein
VENRWQPELREGTTGAPIDLNSLEDLADSGRLDAPWCHGLSLFNNEENVVHFLGDVCYFKIRLIKEFLFASPIMGDVRRRDLEFCTIWEKLHIIGTIG